MQRSAVRRASTRRGLKPVRSTAHPKSERGLIYARAELPQPAANPDMTDPAAIFAEVNKAFAAFKEAQAERDKQIASRFEDVVTADKFDRVNAAVGDFQAALDRMNARVEAMAVASEHGDDPASELRDPAYSAAFNSWFRTGDDERELKATMMKGPLAKIATTSDDEGAILAPVEWDRTLTSELRTVSPIRRLARSISVGVRGFQKHYPIGRPASGWVDEDDARPQTATPTFKPLTFEVMEMYAQPAISQRMLDDSLIDIASWLADEVRQKFADEENAAFVNGDGAKKPYGILDYITGGASAAMHPFGAIELIPSGHASTLTYDGLCDLVYGLPAAYSPNATFSSNRKTFGELRKMKDANNNPIWQPGLAAGEPPTVLSHPTAEIAELPDVGAAATPIIFGDFARGYLIVDRIGIRVLRDPFTAKPLVLFYTTKRTGGGVNDPKAFKVQEIGTGA